MKGSAPCGRPAESAVTVHGRPSRASAPRMSPRGCGDAIEVEDGMRSAFRPKCTAVWEDGEAGTHEGEVLRAGRSGPRSASDVARGSAGALEAADQTGHEEKEEDAPRMQAGRLSARPATSRCARSAGRRRPAGQTRPEGSGPRREAQSQRLVPPRRAGNDWPVTADDHPGRSPVAVAGSSVRLPVLRNASAPGVCFASPIPHARPRSSQSRGDAPCGWSAGCRSAC